MNIRLRPSEVLVWYGVRTSKVLFCAFPIFCIKMATNRATKSGFAAEAQRKVSLRFDFIVNRM